MKKRNVSSQYLKLLIVIFAMLLSGTFICMFIGMATALIWKFVTVLLCIAVANLLAVVITFCIASIIGIQIDDK